MIIMKPNIQLKSTTISGKLLEFYTLIIIALFPLYLFSIELAEISLKTILFFIITLFILFTYLYAFSIGQAKLRKFAGLLDCFVIAFMAVNIISIITGIFQGNYNFERKLFFITLGMLYFLISVGGKYFAYYMDALLLSAMLLFYTMILYFVGFAALSKPLELMVGNPQNMASYLLLINLVSTILYCKTKDKKRGYFYLMMAAMGFFLLFVNEEPMSIYLQILLFLFLPMVYRPTAEFIKRNLQLCFLFFFMWSNMALVSNYWKIIQKEMHYDIMHSIYIDLCLAIMGIVVFSYWDKLPQDKNPEELLLDSVRVIYKRVLQIVLGFSGLFLLAGNKLDKMPQTFGVPTLNGMLKKLQGSYLNRNGTFYDVLLEYGFLWFLVFVLITGYVIQLFLKKYLKNEQTKILGLIAMLFFLQSIFYSQQIVTTPIYLLFLTIGIFEREKKGKIYEKKNN